MRWSIPDISALGRLRQEDEDWVGYILSPLDYIVRLLKRKQAGAGEMVQELGEPVLFQRSLVRISSLHQAAHS